MKPDLLALATRVETETPTREMQQSIALALGWKPQDDPAQRSRRWKRPDGQWHYLPEWLTSYDAAIGLSPPDKPVEIYLDPGRACAQIEVRAGRFCKGKAPAGPCAIVAAALRATAAMGEKPNAE